MASDGVPACVPVVYRRRSELRQILVELEDHRLMGTSASSSSTARPLFPERIADTVPEHTLSAGEMVAAFAQENGLATIVGTKTPGRLLSGSAFKAGFGYMVGLPVAAYLTWEGRLIEGKGVPPSVDVELRPEQLLVREDPQMQRALDVVRRM